LSRYITY